MKYFLFAMIFGVAAAGWQFQDQLAEMMARQSAPPTRASNVFRDKVQTGTIFATGYVEGKSENVELRFETPGRLKTLLVKEGDPLKKGDLIAELDSEVLTERVIQAKAELALAKSQRARLEHAARPETRKVAQAKVRVAQAEVRRLEDRAKRRKQVHLSGASTDEEWEDAFHALEIAKARLAEHQAVSQEVEAPARSDDLEVAAVKIAVAMANLKHAEALLHQTRLVSPMDGTVLHVLNQPGEIVDVADPEPVVVLANLDVIRVRAYVEELNALNVKPGDKCVVQADGLPDQQFAGRVVFCAPWMNQKQYRTHKPNELLDVRTREVVIELDEADQLVVGLPVEVMITPKANKEVIPDSGSRRTQPAVTQCPDPFAPSRNRVSEQSKADARIRN